MKIAILGGTRFIGHAIVEELVENRHELLIIHRGNSEPDDLPDAEHLHVERGDLWEHRAEIADFDPEAFIDTRALTKSDAELALRAMPSGLRTLVLSSADAYLAYEGLHSGVAMDPMPLTEKSPVRHHKYPYRGILEGMDEYEKLDVEETYADAKATILRLPFVYGERDYQRREEFILRRVRAQRKQMPFGVGNFLGTRVYVRDVAKGVRLAIESSTAADNIFNICEPVTLTTRQLAEAIIETADADLELVTVADEILPLDLKLTSAVQQHFFIDASKARSMLGFECRDWRASLKKAVDWHLSNPPTEADEDFSADETALGKN